LKIEIDQAPRASDWDEVLRQSGQGDYRQCYEYGEAVKRRGGGMLPVRFLAWSDRPLGVLQGIRRNRPFSQIVMGGSSGGGPSLIRLPKPEATAVASALVSRVNEYARKNLISRARVHRFEAAGLLDVLTGPHGYRVTRKAEIFLVDLPREASHAWGQMDPPKRRNVRQASEKGVRVRASADKADLSVFHDMFVRFAQDRGFQPFSFRHVEALWDSFRPRDMIRVFIAESGNCPVASALVLNHLDTAFCPYTCYTPEAKDYRANDLLHWKVIEWGVLMGLSRYNMGEVFLDPSSAQHGVYRWKKGFGGHTEPMAILDRRFLTFAEPIEALLRRLRSRGGSLEIHA